ncbi:MAG: ATP-binding cassette domain-containing protein [Anaerolineaceae bacterium]|nr:ATP-binding cassette domain-containing protein [Anaerolineaceae bacterium]
MVSNEQVVLQVRELDVSYLARRGRVRAVTDVTFDLYAGETLAFIGESGCGKSTLNLALMRLLPQTASIDRGSIIYTKRDGSLINVLKLGKEAMRQFLWAECSMVFQGALNSLNPVIRISDMIYDTADAHKMPRKTAQKRALELFERVKLDPLRVFRSYPHELSGGMRQRVLLATSLLLQPQVVILDEPTTAVDILTQRSILDVLKEMRKELNFSMIFISHDLAVAAEIADRIATMYAGNIVEIGPVDDVFYHPRHAYTLSLLNAAPRLSVGREELDSIPGSPPDLINPPLGCKFHPRCSFVNEICKVEQPQMLAKNDHLVACHESAAVVQAGRKV